MADQAKDQKGQPAKKAAPVKRVTKAEQAAERNRQHVESLKRLARGDW